MAAGWTSASEARSWTTISANACAPRAPGSIPSARNVSSLESSAAPTRRRARSRRQAAATQQRAKSAPRLTVAATRCLKTSSVPASGAVARVNAAARTRGANPRTRHAAPPPVLRIRPGVAALGKSAARSPGAGRKRRSAAAWAKSCVAASSAVQRARPVRPAPTMACHAPPAAIRESFPVMASVASRDTAGVAARTTRTRVSVAETRQGNRATHWLEPLTLQSPRSGWRSASRYPCPALCSSQCGLCISPMMFPNGSSTAAVTNPASRTVSGM